MKRHPSPRGPQTIECPKCEGMVKVGDWPHHQFQRCKSDDAVKYAAFDRDASDRDYEECYPVFERFWEANGGSPLETDNEFEYFIYEENPDALRLFREDRDAFHRRLSEYQFKRQQQKDDKSN